jgi:uncharacterized membrane protein YedE/YeeE
MRVATGFLCGVLFALGLTLSGMTLPARVIGFLDFFGAWDPSLAFVMGGALSVFAPVFFFTRRRMTGPVLGGAFDLPTKTEVTPQLLAGASIFGIGWGISGFCPGTVLATLPSLQAEALAVTGGVLLGIVGTRLLQARLAEEVEPIPAADF